MTLDLYHAANHGSRQPQLFGMISGRKQIVFMSDHDDDYEIYVINADGSELIQVTDNDVFDSKSAWEELL